MKIDYPTIRWSGKPTPSEVLLICDKCGNAGWTFQIKGRVDYCSKGHRMREGTAQEYAEARAALVHDDLAESRRET